MLGFVSVPVTLLGKSEGTPSAAEGAFAGVHALMVPNVAQLPEFSEADGAFEHLVVAASQSVSPIVFDSSDFLAPLVNTALLDEGKRRPIELTTALFRHILSPQALDTLGLGVDCREFCCSPDTVHPSFLHGDHATSFFHVLFEGLIYFNSSVILISTINKRSFNFFSTPRRNHC